MNDKPKKSTVDTCTKQVKTFVSYLRNFDPELSLDEAILIAAAIFKELPDAFTDDPEMLSSLKTACQIMKEQRQK